MLQIKPSISKNLASIRTSGRASFNPWKKFSDSSKYLIMDNVARDILKNTGPNNHTLPAMNLYKLSVAPPSTHHQMVAWFIANGGVFITPLSICHIVAALTENQPEGEDGFLRTDGKMTVIGFLDAENVIIAFWNSLMRRWAFGWHSPSEWPEEADLIIKRYSSATDMNAANN